MKHIVLLTILSACMLASCHTITNSQSATINQSTKDVRGNEILIGKCSKSALMKDPYKTCY